MIQVQCDSSADVLNVPDRGCHCVAGPWQVLHPRLDIQASFANTEGLIRTGCQNVMKIMI